MRLACLHTADSNVQVFDEAADGLGIRLIHRVRTDLLADADDAGHLTDAIATRTAKALDALIEDADAVILSCSTLGPVVRVFQGRGGVPVLRVDEALARAVGASGQRVTVLCAAPTTLDSTTSLFQAEAAGTATQLDVRMVPGAWDLFLAGERRAYLHRIAAAADAAWQDGAQQVALAQSSMAPAVRLCARGAPWSSPGAAVAAAMKLARGLV